MSCVSPIRCEPKATREGELEADVLIVGSGLGGLAAALELKKYGYNPKVVYVGRVGGHRAIVPSEAAVDVVNKAGVLDLHTGFFDGMYVYQGDGRYRVKYKHLVLATGGVDVPITFPNSTRAPQKTAEELLSQKPSGLNIVVWGTTEWGFKTALALRDAGNDVVVMDNSAYARDAKYYERVKTRLEVITAVRLRSYEDELVYEEITERGAKIHRKKVDLIVSTVRIVNPLAVARLGFKVFYSFELNSLVPRRNNYGELLTLGERDVAVGGSNVYSTGHLYGALSDDITIEQGRLLALYIASKDGVEDAEKTKSEMEKFLGKLSIEANWLYNLGNRLEKGTDGTGRYVEPNVVDVPHWASFWPQMDVDEDVVICPCDGTSMGRILEVVREMNRRVKLKITHEEVDILRHLKTPKLSFGTTCGESLCVPYASIMLAAALSQKPSYFLYGKPQMLYE